MNLLFQALAILAFVLPGVLFRGAYFQGAWTSPLGRLGSVSEQVPRALVAAAALNWIVYVAVTSLHRGGCPLVLPIDLESVVCWLSNNFGDRQAKYDRAVAALTLSPTRVFFYFAALYSLAWGGGLALHHLVRGRKWDRKHRLLRFDNAWHYLLKGEVLDFPDPEYARGLPATTPSGGPNKREATIIAAVVDGKDASYLYIGTLVDFFFDAGGELDRVLLEAVKRRRLGADDAPREPDGGLKDQERFYPVKGRFFVLRLSEVKTINIDYLTTADIERMNAMDAESDSPAARRAATPAAEQVAPFPPGERAGDG